MQQRTEVSNIDLARLAPTNMQKEGSAVAPVRPRTPTKYGITFGIVENITIKPLNGTIETINVMLRSLFSVSLFL